MSSLRLNFPIILLILLGFGLRIHDLEAAPLRGDEAFSALYWSDVSLANSLSQIAPIDPHPPLAFALFRIWAVILGGIDSVFSLRFISVIGNTLGIAAMYCLARRLTGRRDAGLIAALIWALHPYEIWHSQDYRNYAVWAGASAVSLWLGLRLLDKCDRKDWLLYAFASFSAALLFYAEVLNVVALSCAVALAAGRGRQFTLRFLALQLAIALTAIGAFIVIQARSDFFGVYGGNLEPFAAADYLTRFIPALMFGDTFGATLAAIWPLMALVYAFALLAVWFSSPRQFATLVILTWLPLLLLGVVSLSRDVFNPRYVLNTVPALILVLTIASLRAAELLQKTIRLNHRILVLCVLSPWLVLAGLALQTYFNVSAFSKSPAWDELGRFLSSRVNESDLVIQLSVDPAFAYYYAGDAPELALPTHSAQTEDEINAALAALRGSFNTVFVVSREQAGWANAGMVEAWMGENLQEVMRTDVAGLPVRQYAEWRAPQDSAAMTRFGDAVALLGYEFFASPLPIGELLLWVYWLPTSPTEGALKSFAHLYGGAKPGTEGALRSQDDQFPQRRRLDSRSWEIGTAFRDVYYLPALDLEDGDYRVSVGWYDQVSGRRLQVADGSDAVELEAFSYAALKGADQHSA